MRTLQQANSHPTPGVSIPDRNWSEKATHVRASSTTSICSTASSLPNSVLRKGKYDTSLNEILTHPLGQLIDVNIIYRTYGKTVSLYNILCIEPSADYDTIRRAYLKQGRKALLGHDEEHRIWKRRCGRANRGSTRCPHMSCFLAPVSIRDRYTRCWMRICLL
jgi:hypothetical protein